MAIRFGRYSDSFKPKDKVDAWTESEKLFEEKKFLDSYNTLFRYIKDDTQNNVKLSGENGRIKFELLQGTKIVKGYADEKKVTAESHIAGFEKLSVAVMRRLMEMNFSLFYTRFALKDNLICIKFDSSTADGSPRKLYYAFKELATRADKQDDLLIDDFSTLKPVETAPIETLPESEKEIKYKYFVKWINDTLKRVSELKEDSFAGGISYLLLNLLYKIDYLITPEGTLMNELEKISFGYFAKDNKSFIEKNRNMKEAFQKLAAMPKEKIVEDFYRVKSTFGIANPAAHQAVIDVFNSNLMNVKWYLDNKYEDIAYAIYEYAAGHCVFTYGLAKPTVQLFHLVYNILEQDYFNELGFEERLYFPEEKKFNEKVIKDRINKIIEEGKVQYPQLAFKTDNLKFETMAALLRTYFTEVHGLNYES
jgi:hypothetical protein